ncbi:phage major tail tube protein [uncultured Roseibium sp.]|uniref:phage major tail tube protein n=1 Tax=uncultured Roseibium sp. TaxID=1936171 RepID=UPI00263A1E09|nr:phage major tail tube protein [uncultured Roseibium sp.]
MKKLYMLTGVDLRRAKDPESSRHTIISKLVLPAVKFKTANHNPGGGVGSVDFTLPRIEPLEPAMEVKGIDTEIFKGFGGTEDWTFACAYKDKTTGLDVPARGIIRGVVAEWEPDESDPDAFQGCNYSFKEVTHFDFTLNNEPVFYFDFFENEIRPNGESLTAGFNAALGI